ncbi:MAG: Na(+)/H(+) antiporter subunit B [Candidatus Delongbacteria bacterium]|nr:Na(+)/H(+) antiporter subunit B [Candidatus Delongbacteria bacterium]MCG2759983.1 Na(+)/H(+) antiporter subunit B [Candidatus Delongbacteria bacterium]
MIKKMFSFILIIFLFLILFELLNNLTENKKLSGVAKEYAERGAAELGTANLVTSIVVTYRGLDTLGEVSVLFIAATGVAVLLRRRKDEEILIQKVKRQSSEILQTGTDLLVPIIIMFGVYIFINGHLSPGGGFQGGAVIASAVLLSFLSDINYKINHTVFGLIESLSGVFYVLIGVLGIFLAGGFLDNRILPLGEYGTILSAGAIPLIYTLIGLKVGTELASIIDNMKRDSE